MNTNSKQYQISDLERAFNPKLTENGDNAFSSTQNILLDILFMSEYYTKHLEGVPDIGDSQTSKVFAMFMRDPRLGIGRRDLGRVLMSQAHLTPRQIVLCGRYDDLYLMPNPSDANIIHLIDECRRGNELAKKWMPRYSSKHLMIARNFAKTMGFNKQQYGHFVKANTVENTMSRKQWEDIEFEHVPSLAAVRYAKAFQRHQPERYAQYIADVKAGKKELHVSTTNVYDIYKNRGTIHADVFYEKLEKINISCIPIIDVSGSMWSDDAMGKALSVGKYLSDCSTYCNGQFVTFSARPKLVTQRGVSYNEKIDSIVTADWGMNTDLGAVMELLKNLQNSFPEYLVILSDMEFDRGSSTSKDELMKSWKVQGIETKIIWWNFNSRNKTVPETDEYGNIFMSGYSPMLLKYLEAGFDGNQFLNKLLIEYVHNLGVNIE